MYCIQCGVKLADSETVCPLCGTVPYHPDLPRPAADPLYPTQHHPLPAVRSRMTQIVATTLFLLPLVITMLVDLRVNAAITWSGYVTGALLLAYGILVLPLWFSKPHPLVFVPCDFLFAAVYLLYLNEKVHGSWFWTFALPITACCGVVVCVTMLLLRLLRRGRLYIFGGAAVVSGLLCPVMELLFNLTFHRDRFLGWSVYPLAALILLGGMLIFLAVDRQTREKMARKFFV